MTIETAGRMAKMGRVEGMVDAANLVSTFADSFVRKASKHNKLEEYDMAEHYESVATAVEEAATKIRKAAKRLR